MPRREVFIAFKLCVSVICIQQSFTSFHFNRNKTKAQQQEQNNCVRVIGDALTHVLCDVLVCVFKKKMS